MRDWREYAASAFARANRAREQSPDTSSKIGAAITDLYGHTAITGFNTFPKGVVVTPERLERPLKYKYTEHAERNAIYAAARLGCSLEGCTLFLIGMGPPTVPCVECARAIIQSGIVRVVGFGYKPVPEHWIDDLNMAKDILAEGGVEFVEWQLAKPVAEEQPVEVTL